MTPECRHIRTSGGKCTSRALLGKPYCYFHIRQRERASQQMPSALSLAFTSLEDRGAIQHAICEVSIALVEHRLEAKQASALLYALQIASSNLRETEEIVCSEPVAEIARTEDGEEMAPEGATSVTEEEESLADLIKKAVIRHSRGLDEEHVPGQPLQPEQNTDLGQKPGVEGGSPPAELIPSDPVPVSQAPAGHPPTTQSRAKTLEEQLIEDEREDEYDLRNWPLDEFGHPKPLFDRTERL